MIWWVAKFFLHSEAVLFCIMCKSNDFVTSKAPPHLLEGAAALNLYFILILDEGF